MRDAAFSSPNNGSGAFNLFAKNRNFIDPVFSNLTLDDKGSVLFELNFSVNSSFVNYKETFLTQAPG